jgi:1-acyl-sn-glycerol-3-phosphate acyltransferase
MSSLRSLRAGLRLLPAGLSTVGAILVLLPAVPLGLVAPRWRARWNNLVFTAWARFNLWLVGARVTVAGPPPEPPFLLVANHLSYVDILLLASRIDAVFVSKASVRHWPVIGLACRLVRTVFIQRAVKRNIPKVLREIEDRLRYGQGVIVFPEGTSSAGAHVARFRPSLLEAAAQADLPVSYASLAYRALPRESPAHLSVCWWGGMTFPDHFLRLLAMPGFEASLAFGAEPIRHGDRKELTERLHRAVSGLFEPSAPPDAETRAGATGHPVESLETV